MTKEELTIKAALAILQGYWANSSEIDWVYRPKDMWAAATEFVEAVPNDMLLGCPTSVEMSLDRIANLMHT